MEWLIAAIVLWGIVEICNTNTEFYTRRYSNGITIVTNRKTGQRWMKAAGTDNLVPIDDEEKN